jgi:hypothetical protein
VKHETSYVDALREVQEVIEQEAEKSQVGALRAREQKVGKNVH